MGEYNTLQHVEVREKIGILGLYVATLQPGACMGSAAADVERMAIAAIYAAATPLLADVANLRSQAEATRAAAARERDRMRGNVDAWRTRAEAAEQRAEAAEQRAEAAEAALAAAQAELTQARGDARVLVGLWHGRFPRSPSTLGLSDDEATDLFVLSYQQHSNVDVAAIVRRALGVAS